MTRLRHRARTVAGDRATRSARSAGRRILRRNVECREAHDSARAGAHAQPKRRGGVIGRRRKRRDDGVVPADRADPAKASVSPRGLHRRDSARHLLRERPGMPHAVPVERAAARFTRSPTLNRAVDHRGDDAEGAELIAVEVAEIAP